MLENIQKPRKSYDGKTIKQKKKEPKKKHKKCMEMQTHMFVYRKSIKKLLSFFSLPFI